MKKLYQSDYYKRFGQLKTERSSYVSHWKEISDYLIPRSGRFFVQDKNMGQRRHNAIYDSTGTRALRVLAAGMMAGMTSPARPWFKLATADSELMKYGPVKVWLNEVTKLMLTIFQRSNTYRSLHSMYEELGAFGTGAAVIMDDFNSVIRHYTLTIGEFCLAQNFRGEVDCLYREFDKTVAELVKEFGYDKCSKHVRNLFDRGNLDVDVTIVHAIEPREDRDPKKKDAKNMAFKSIYFELGRDRDGEEFLSESGFEKFPAVCPRWGLIGGDVYGSSPGMEALGDIKQLQHEQLRKAEAIDYKTKPPLQIPTSMKNRDVDSLPGGLSFVDATAQGGIRTMFEVALDLNHLLMDIQDVRTRINSTFYADLFLMLSQAPTNTMTATEVAERHEEKLLMLGPVLERLHNELLDPLINITFDKMIRAGIVPPPPEELQGQEINVEFVSMLAQAQRAVGTNAVDRFIGTIGAVAQARPDVLDKFDTDKWADIYSEMLGVDPELIVPDDKVALVRQQRAQQQAQMQQMAMAQQGAQAAKDMSQVNTKEKNGLTDLINQFSGYTIPQGGQ